MGQFQNAPGPSNEEFNNVVDQITNKWEREPGYTNFLEHAKLRMGYDGTLGAVCIDGVFSDGRVQRLQFDGSQMKYRYWDGTSWSDVSVWTKDS